MVLGMSIFCVCQTVSVVNKEEFAELLALHWSVIMFSIGIAQIVII